MFGMYCGSDVLNISKTRHMLFISLKEQWIELLFCCVRCFFNPLVARDSSSDVITTQFIILEFSTIKEVISHAGCLCSCPPLVIYDGSSGLGIGIPSKYLTQGLVLLYKDVMLHRGPPWSLFKEYTYYSRKMWLN